MTARSGQITVSTAGTAVRGTSVTGYEFAITAHPDNTGVVYVGNDGANDVAATNGYPLGTAEGWVVVKAGNLNELWFDAATNGDKVCWLRTR